MILVDTIVYTEAIPTLRCFGNGLDTISCLVLFTIEVLTSLSWHECSVFPLCLVQGNCGSTFCGSPSSLGFHTLTKSACENIQLSIILCRVTYHTYNYSTWYTKTVARKNTWYSRYSIRNNWTHLSILLFDFTVQATHTSKSVELWVTARPYFKQQRGLLAMIH